VQALQKLVAALGTDCLAAFPLAVPLVQYCTNPREPEACNLLEDGLQLWHECLKHAPSGDTSLLPLFAHLSPVLQISTEHVQVQALNPKLCR
jgi:hypothetical protein